MVGSIGIAHINVCAVCVALLEAVKSRQALSLAPRSMRYDAPVTLYSSLPDIGAGDQYIVGVDWSCNTAGRFTRQCLLRFCEAKFKTLISSEFEVIA